MYIKCITRQTFNYATLISFDSNQQNVKTFDFDTNEQYVLTRNSVFLATPTLLKPKQVQSTVSRSFFTAQEAGIYSNAELTNLGNRVLITE